MTHMAAKDAKNRFGQMLDAAQRGPVSIEKHGRPVAVVISQEEYERMQALKIASLHQELQTGLDDVLAGRLVDGEAALTDLLERFKS